MKLSTDLAPLRVLHPRENLYAVGNLAAVNAEIAPLLCDGCTTGTLDLRGAAVGTVIVEGYADDGVNPTQIAIRPVAGGAWQVAATTAGAYTFNCGGFRRVRARMTAVGVAATILTVSMGEGENKPTTTDLIVTNTGAASAAVTLTLPAPGAGFRQYLTRLRIDRFAAAALTAAAAPVVGTTTNVPGALAFSFPADAALQGTLSTVLETFDRPVPCSAQNTAATIVLPAITNVIWRATAGYYIAP